MSDDHCAYEFSWSKEREQEFSKYGDIRREPDSEDGKDIIGEIGEFEIRSHNCGRPAEDGSDRCFWHQERDDKSTAELKKALDDQVSVVCEPYLCESTLSGVDLTGCGLFWAKFEDADLEGIDASNATISYGKFTDATIEAVDFSDANLVGTRFVDATFNNSKGGKEDTSFVNTECSGVNFIQAEFNHPPEFKNANFDRDSLLCRNLIDANFESADLSETDFSDLTLTGANFTGANLSSAEITADFTNANLSEVYAFDADLSDSTLERAVLDSANLQSADLKRTKLHSAVISDAIIDHDTRFDTEVLYEVNSEKSKRKDTKTEKANRAIWTYNALSSLSKENALSKQAQQYYVKEKDLKRRLNWLVLAGPVSPRFDGKIGFIESKVRHLANLLHPSGESQTSFTNRFLNNLKSLGNCVKAEISRFTIKYGEGHWNVLLSLGVVTLFYSLLYPIWGIQLDGDPIRYSLSIQDIISGSFHFDLDIWFTSLYFSVVTFTTLGYGDIRPMGFSQYIAASEAVIGASLMALLVFVLGRRATW